jgi:CRP-like cAMP-binding protein
MTCRWEHPSEHSFWMSLDTAERQAYADAAAEQVFRHGTILCREGTHSTHVVVITSGWATVAVSARDRERIVTVRGPGDVIGERAALTLRSRSATVSSLGDVTGLVMPASRFQALTAKHPRILLVLERQERERLAEDGDPPHDPEPEAVEHRLADLLCELAFRRGEQTAAGMTLSLPVSRKEIARWVDAEHDEVSRVLDAWRRNGLVSTTRQRLTVLDATRLDELCRRRPGEVPWSSLNCSIFFTDVAGFSADCRDESDRQAVRDALYAILRESFEESQVPWTTCYHEDRGDGVLIIVPPAIPTQAVTDPLLALLAARLRRHNRRSSAALRIQLRAALHVGPVTRDREGLNGDAIIHTARLLDAPPLREELKRSGADLGFMASGHVFDTVIRHAPGLVDPSAFRPVRFQLKESKISAWMYVSRAGGAPAPVPTSGEASTDTRATAASPKVTHFHGTVQVDGDLILGDKVVGND